MGMSEEGRHITPEYYLNSTKGKVYLRLPEGWQVANNATLNLEEAKNPISNMLIESINNPIGTPPLKSLLQGKENILLIVDDATRPTPREAILTCLLNQLHQYGVQSNQITALIALGTHRPLTETEIEEAFGAKIYREIRFLNHDCRADDLISVGMLKYGGELKIHPLAVAVDLRIGIGCILPHPFAGFGGGPKVLFPGICNYEAIRKHHLALMIAEWATLGNYKNNPFQNEICEAARLGKLDFIINTVHDSEEHVKTIVAGHFQQAHLKGIDTSMKELAVQFDQAADVTILSAFPHSEGPQIMKPIGTGTMVTKKGGVLIFYIDSIKGGQLPNILFEAFDAVFAMAGDNPAQLVIDFLREGKCMVPDASMDLNLALNTALLYQNRVNIVLVSPDVNKQQAARLGLDHANSLDEAIHSVAAKIPRATVNILPSGGLIVPQLTEKMQFNWI